MPHIINTDTTKYQALFNQHIISYDEPSISEGVHIHDTFEYNHFNEILTDSIKMLKVMDTNLIQVYIILNCNDIM